MRTARLAWTQLRRDLAAGEVRIMLAALVLAVLAVTAVGFVTDRAGRALAAEANRLLGGDADVSETSEAILSLYELTTWLQEHLTQFMLDGLPDADDDPGNHDESDLDGLPDDDLGDSGTGTDARGDADADTGDGLGGGDPGDRPRGEHG